MEEIYAACIAYEPSFLDFFDFKKADEPVWLLGVQHQVNGGDDIENLNEDIKSRLWFTYRKQFLAIGNTALTSDSGWGCMHRCGQMLLAQALVIQRLGRDWKWKADATEEEYNKLLQLFNDNVECQFSIHKIAIMGCVLEKEIGQWFGPNTVVQVLRRLVEEDVNTDISVHVAMDNMVIKSDIRKLFHKTPNGRESASEQCPAREAEEHNGFWTERPVLLTIPLRLGLSEITPVYFDKLKAVFKIKQSLGIIGGRTNHASYFIGFIGNELIYLDPHTTQLYLGADSPMNDSTYHCPYPSRMPFTQLDPSVALCFYLKNEEDFEVWCKVAQQLLLEPEKDAVFEILEEKPPMLSFVDLDDDEECLSLNDCSSRVYTSDEEFELLM